MARKAVIAGLMLIFIDILNLAEQFGIYFISQDSSLDQTTQQRFFFILFGIGAATLFEPMFLWSKLKVIFSMLIEVGELTAYLTLLPRSTNLIIVASIFFAFEMVLHLIHLYTVESNCDEITSGEFIRAYCLLPVRILFYGLIYSSPIIFLFLASDSKFDDTYYQILLILNVFFGVTYIDLTITPCCASDTKPAEHEIIYRAWQYLTIIIYNILAIIIMVTTMVFAGQALHSNSTGEVTLSQYDFGVYVYCLVDYGLLGLGQILNCCSVCMKTMASGLTKR